MSKRLTLFIVVVMVVTTATLGGLFAESSTAGLSVSASGAAQSGSTVAAWESVGAGPSWSPVQGAVGAISGGGIIHVEVPNSPPGQWTATLLVDDPNELVQAYTF